jgi:hypothetical protein
MGIIFYLSGYEFFLIFLPRVRLTPFIIIIIIIIITRNNSSSNSI